MPGIMRLFVRVEGLTPFALILDDNLLPEHYVEIALKYFREMKWHATREAPELVLLRRIVFKNSDQLLDFRKKRTAKAKARVQIGGTTTDRDGHKIYECARQPEKIKTEMIVAQPRDVFPMCETELLPKAVTLNRLIMKMTDPSCPPYIEDAFWDTFRQFTTPREVLDKLMQRFEVPPLVQMHDPQRSPLDLDYYEDLRQQIKVKVFQCLEHWVQRYYFDFAEDDVYNTLSRWIREKVDTEFVPTKLQLMMKKGDRTALSRRSRVPMPGVLSRLPSSAVLAQYSPQKLAEQLSLLTLHVHNHIYPCELFGRQIEGPDQASIPNLINYRDFVNKVSNWTTYAVVSERNANTRVQNLASLLHLCENLRNMNNWDMLVAVYGGISDPTVRRLTDTRQLLLPEERQIEAKLEEQLSIRKSSQELKQLMAVSNRPHFLSLVVYMKEFSVLDDLPMEDGNMINFSKCVQQHRKAQMILDGQNSQLDYIPEPEVQGVFTFWTIVDDALLLENSMQCQHN